jgi:hypothetical protein
METASTTGCRTTPEMNVNRRYIPIHKESGLYYTAESVSFLPFASKNPQLGIRVAEFALAGRLCASEVRILRKRRKDVDFRIAVNELVILSVMES